MKSLISSNSPIHYTICWYCNGMLNEEVPLSQKVSMQHMNQDRIELVAAESQHTNHRENERRYDEVFPFTTSKTCAITSFDAVLTISTVQLIFPFRSRWGYVATGWSPSRCTFYSAQHFAFRVYPRSTKVWCLKHGGINLDYWHKNCVQTSLESNSMGFSLMNASFIMNFKWKRKKGIVG